MSHASPISTGSSSGKTPAVPGSWRAQAAAKPGGRTTALVAVLGRVRRVAFAEPKLGALREALGKQKGLDAAPLSYFRVAADPDGVEEVLTDEQLERLVRAGRPLHVLQEDISDSADATFRGDGTMSIDGATEVTEVEITESLEEDDKARAELRDLRVMVQQLCSQEQELATEILQERQHRANLETSLEEVRIRQERQEAELTLAREARESGEAELRLYADGLYGTALGVATRLEQQVANLQVQVEEELRSKALQVQSSVACPDLQSPELRKAIDAQLLEKFGDMERTLLSDLEKTLRKGCEGMLSEKIEFIERTIRQDLMDSTRAAHSELRTTLDAMFLRGEQNEAKRQGELEATMAQRLAAMETSIRKVERTHQQTTGHLETVVSYVAAIQQDAARRDAEIKKVQQSVHELKERTRVAVQGTLGLLAEAHSEGDSPAAANRSQSPTSLRMDKPLLDKPLASLGSLPVSSTMGLLPGLPELTSVSTAEDDGASLQDLSRHSNSSITSTRASAVAGVLPSGETKTPVLSGNTGEPRRGSATIPRSTSSTDTGSAEAQAKGEKARGALGEVPSLGSRGTAAKPTRSPDRSTQPSLRRPLGFDPAGSMRSISTDSAPTSSQVRVPSSETVFSSRSLIGGTRRDARSPSTNSGLAASATASPAQTSAGRATFQDRLLTGQKQQQQQQSLTGQRQQPQTFSQLRPGVARTTTPLDSTMQVQRSRGEG